MQVRSTVFLLIALSALCCLAYQPARPAVQLREIHPTEASRVAQVQAVDARRRLLAINENAQKVLTAAEASNTPDNQAKAAEAQKQVAAAQQEVAEADKKAQQAQAAPVSQQDWSNLQGVLKEKKDGYEKNLNYYSRLATTLVLAGIVFSVAGAFAGFLRKGIAAGVISILVTGLVGVPRLFPVNQRAEYYRALFVQSSSLYVQSQLRLSRTAADYNQFVASIQVLSDYEANKFPSGGDVGENMQNLVKDMAAAAPGAQ